MTPFAALMLALLAPLAPAVAESPTAGRLSGSPFEHRVEPGESLWSVGARHGVGVAALARDNGLSPEAWLQVGQGLLVDPRHVVPASLERGVVLNVPQRMLFFFDGNDLLEAFPVAVGRPSWPTPLGDFHVIDRQVDKTWHVPLSIQREMCREGRPVLTEVPPGPENPLGRHWLGLSRRGYGIHGTIAPTSIHHFITHGCIRMHPDDVAVLFAALQVGDAVRIVYDPVLLASLPDGRVFLEAHPDAYRRAGDPLERARELAERSGCSARIDWERAQQVLQAREGIAREVSREPGVGDGVED